ncbi:peptidase inhibitor family I36 protein [Streptomyces alkaliphilus]|uniref:peptidase inhibitor family I36 protein n=1 Tax=Streptomyces alkaliphilus TaxID=1472722 RepID=UPI001566F1BA|nr:peptidase inhibitor family I36 protein [Streptomyces alkaliphilus]
MKDIAKRFSALFAGAVLAAGVMMGVSPAHAADDSAGALPYASTASVGISAAPSGCSATNVCFWSGTNYSGAGPGQLSGANPNWAVFSNSSCPGGNWENCASSVYNNGTSCSAVLWTSRNYSGARLTLARGSGQTRLSSTMNNAISSNSWSC